MITQVVINKYVDHLPLYRQEQIFSTRHGIDIPRQTLCRWVELAAWWLEPVYDEMVLNLTYTSPIGIEESHAVDKYKLTVNVSFVSTDSRIHNVMPVLIIETVGGLTYKTMTHDITAVSDVPKRIIFELDDIELSKYVVRILSIEDDIPIGEMSFAVIAPTILIKEVYPYPDASQDSEEEWI